MAAEVNQRSQDKNDSPAQPLNSEIRLLQQEDRPFDDAEGSIPNVVVVLADPLICCDPSLLRNSVGFKQLDFSVFCGDPPVCCPNGEWSCSNNACLDTNGVPVPATGEVCIQKCCDPSLRNSVGFKLPDVSVFCDEPPVCCPNGEWSCPYSGTLSSPADACLANNGVPVFPNGQVCIEKCCDPALRTKDGIIINRDWTKLGVSVKLCQITPQGAPQETPQCCPDGNWVCSTNTPNGQRYQCGGTELAIADGLICEEKCCELIDKDLCIGAGVFTKSACCPDGTWVCPDDASVTPLAFTCGERILHAPEGKPCETCCLRETEPTCYDDDPPACCEDGRWSCRPGFDSGFGCHDVDNFVIGVNSPKGDVCDEAPWMYVEPDWWERIKKDHVGSRLKRCFKRQHHLQNGFPCTSNPKTCYWGDKQCPNAITGPFPYPSVKCSCSGSKWNCVAQPCPPA